MPARRCSTCSHDYPNDLSYRACLECGGETWVGQNVDPMPAADLGALKARMKSEKEAVAQRPNGLEDQWLIAYDDPQGQNANGERRTEVFFATAYSVEEARRQMDVCKSVNGVDTDVRCFVSRARPPLDGGEIAAGSLH